MLKLNAESTFISQLLQSYSDTNRNYPRYTVPRFSNYN